MFHYKKIYKNMYIMKKKLAIEARNNNHVYFELVKYKNGY
jgi:hypothetical protein